jgi:hypothetical protein
VSEDVLVISLPRLDRRSGNVVVGSLVEDYPSVTHIPTGAAMLERDGGAHSRRFISCTRRREMSRLAFYGPTFAGLGLTVGGSGSDGPCGFGWACDPTTSRPLRGPRFGTLAKDGASFLRPTQTTPCHLTSAFFTVPPSSRSPRYPRFASYRNGG